MDGLITKKEEIGGRFNCLACSLTDWMHGFMEGYLKGFIFTLFCSFLFSPLTPLYHSSTCTISSSKLGFLLFFLGKTKKKLSYTYPSCPLPLSLSLFVIISSSSRRPRRFFFLLSLYPCRSPLLSRRYRPPRRQRGRRLLLLLLVLLLLLLFFRGSEQTVDFPLEGAELGFHCGGGLFASVFCVT